uniref:Uncharacterized protein n=1 Tax=Trypanosoma congolense (strain IL3000) TaxID=1068625 RepID=G0UZB1_TRYCI|nr:hypothetical protein, unlikely [Trypanosoma congolense IL3000]
MAIRSQPVGKRTQTVREERSPTRRHKQKERKKERRVRTKQMIHYIETTAILAPKGAEEENKTKKTYAHMSLITWNELNKIIRQLLPSAVLNDFPIYAFKPFPSLST